MKPNAALEARIQATYEAVPEHIRDDIYEAAKWAKETLANREGAGHQIYVSAAGDGLVCCSFAKGEWAGRLFARSHTSAVLERGG